MMTMTLTSITAVDGAAGADSAHGEAVRGRAALSLCPPRSWYIVRDFESRRAFYKQMLGLRGDLRRLGRQVVEAENGSMLIALAE